ncbi:uracil-DNA glycosylase [Gilvimarinus sp. SDUM040013]|uniref:Uracil-DNA glycosylase n=1 Tax=Gilvimarinus gilvus TaxID=3058038 RepID=A0ABU4S1J5_9GAMM|nr:uracil-DNA glycosylase [Gilvimarinus sp. SDUM040013]MDO3386523.1 uracil-DNA glycosylase [Gilvimarinus sp. SDUM040013]MDX6849099.1 uracil-DNA glycosylase [Gilvimarinus sp. SDUM040013]
MANSVDLEPGWLRELEGEFSQPHMLSLKAFLLAQKQAKKVVFPPSQLMFNAFNSTPFDKVKVVILGQDPYHGPGQAHGLCFSVPEGVKPPPSLVNIFKEIERDLGIERPDHGCLQRWAEQGVLLLNATLSVEQGRAGSHQKQGWESFTDAAIDALNRDREGVVFLLWGSYAQKKGRLIDTRKHLVLKSPHPSPLSAHRGFIGNGHFSQANEYLRSRGVEPIDWRL